MHTQFAMLAPKPHQPAGCTDYMSQAAPLQERAATMEATNGVTRRLWVPQRVLLGSPSGGPVDGTGAVADLAQALLSGRMMGRLHQRQPLAIQLLARES